MASKLKAEGKVPTLKGQEAEDKVLEYLKRMNRPYGAVDVAANLKGAVPKTAVQKILVALAEKGDLVQKTYGKSTFFVANQANLEVVPAEKLAALESQTKVIVEGNKQLTMDVKALTAELSKAKTTLTNEELTSQIQSTESEIALVSSRLEPLRSGAQPISAEELQKLQLDWEKWKAGWIRRRKVFQTLWGLVTDPLPPQDAETLQESLGIEYDTPEHRAIEQGPLFHAHRQGLKRKRS
ncbi:Tat binding protein 1-interacting protein-domain-containing protein [Coprinopsis sp. MPI-PUGE-AT-0042]|nr:Tat binding protein 1-interacting protein-domain-containing protein [Coprinopsis sp. MPI-PUGE-AT-0042]